MKHYLVLFKPDIEGVTGGYSVVNATILNKIPANIIKAKKPVKNIPTKEECAEMVRELNVA